MRCTKLWAICGTLALSMAGCGGNSLSAGDLGRPLDDGHVQAGCFVDADCDDGKKCHTFTCNLGTHACVYNDVQCSSSDPCNTSACDPNSGQCALTAANDGTACTDSMGMGGSCAAGTCTPPPTCYGSNQFATIYCDSGYLRYRDDQNVVTSFGNATNVVNSYPCAPNETAPEVAYSFSPIAGPVTVSLHVTSSIGSDGGVPTDGGTTADMAGTADADLDLIILDGACTSKAACMNPALTGGGYQGITAGTGTERVTFNAVSGHTYYVVVDGKNAAQANFHVEIESCGQCSAPTSAQRLACGQSIAAPTIDTSTGTSVLSSYTCTGITNPVMAPGKERAFRFEATAPNPQPIKATVVGNTGAVTLLALSDDFNGQCDPTACAGASTIAAGAGGSLTFPAVRYDSSTPGIYWVVVDTPVAGTNSTLGLQIDCLPYCNNDSLATVACDTLTTRQATGNNGATGSTNLTSAWGPNPGTAPCGGLSNLTGPEYVYLFATPAGVTQTGQQYTISLASTDAGNPTLSLVVLKAGTTAPTACDTSLACATTSGTYTTSGTTPASVTLTSDGPPSNYYYIVVDGPSGHTGNFTLNVTGVGAGSLCM